MEEEEELYGAETVWRTTGKYMSTINQYRRSLFYFDEAVNTCPKDKKTLVDRSVARGRVCLFEGALDDINKAVEIDPQDIVTLGVKAHAVYLNCEIEEALVQNYRLLKRRTKPDNFSMGVRHCISALEHSLGEICGRPLRDHFIIIRHQAWLKTLSTEKKGEFIPAGKKLNKKKPKTKDINIVNKMKELGDTKLVDKELEITDSLFSHKSEEFVVPPLATPFRFAPLQRYTSNVENYMAEKYLEHMYRDKLFLKLIRTNPGVTSPNSAGSARIKDVAKDGYRNVANKQEVLRSRRPFYYIKFQEVKATGKLKLRQHAELQLQQQNIKIDADKISTHLETKFNENNLGAVLDLVEKLKLFIDSKTRRLLPDKDRYHQQIYRIIRRAFYNVNRLNEEQVRWDQDKRILSAFGQPVSREPSSDSVISFYQNWTRTVDFSQRIQLFEGRLHGASNDDELCWYYHELGRYYLLAKDFDNAKSAARSCIYAAESYNQPEWIVNAKMILVRIFARQRSKTEALNEVQSTLNIAEKLKDNTLQKYLRRCSMIINDLEFDDPTGKQRMLKRQEKILALLQSHQLKEEFAFLSRSLPAKRPSRRESDRKRSVDSRMTIDSVAGIQFMSMIKFE